MLHFIHLAPCSFLFVLPGAHRTGREHVTSQVHSIDSEIQTWRRTLNIVVYMDFYNETGNIKYIKLREWQES